MSGVCSAARRFSFLILFYVPFVCRFCFHLWKERRGNNKRREDCYAAGNCFSGFKRGSHFAGSHQFRNSFPFLASLSFCLSLGERESVCGKKQFVSTMHKNTQMFICICLCMRVFLLIVHLCSTSLFLFDFSLSIWLGIFMFVMSN